MRVKWFLLVIFIVFLSCAPSFSTIPTSTYVYDENVGDTPGSLYFVATNSMSITIPVRPYMTGGEPAPVQYWSDTEGNLREDHEVQKPGLIQRDLPDRWREEYEDVILIGRETDQIINPEPISLNVPGDSKVFRAFSDPNKGIGNVPATLRKSVGPISTSFGDKYLNIWVADDQWEGNGGRVDNLMIDVMGDAFLKTGLDNDIYDWVTTIFGEAWGSHHYSSLIPDTNVINILLHDILSDNSRSGGLLGYFHTKDNHKRDYKEDSNEMVMFSIDSVLFSEKSGGSWDRDDYWPSEMLSTLAHELQHAIHFYQKTIKNNLKRYSETWLNEMCSVVTEEFIAQKLGGNGPRGINSSIPSSDRGPYFGGRIPLFNNYSDASVTNWYPSENSENLINYSTVYVFGTWLARNYGGIDLFGSIAQNNRTNFYAINDAIVSLTGETKSKGEILAEWGTAVLHSAQQDLSSPLKYNSANDFIEFSDWCKVGSVNLFEFRRLSLVNYSSGPLGPQLFDAAYTFGKWSDHQPNSNILLYAGSNLTGIRRFVINDVAPNVIITPVFIPD